MWPGQQPPGGEQNPQDQNPYQQPGYQQPNPYQQPGYQQPGYQQPGYQQPNPYQQPQPGQPGYPPPQHQPNAGWSTPQVPPGAPEPPRRGGKRKTTIAVIVAVAVVAAAVITGVMVLGKDDGKKDDQAKDDRKTATATPSATSDESADPGTGGDQDDSRGRGGDTNVKAVIPGWKPVVNAEHHDAFDVPADWSVKGSGWSTGFGDKTDKTHMKMLVAMSGPAYYKENYCTVKQEGGAESGSSMAGVGTKGAQGAATEAEAAQNEANNWVFAAYDQDKTGTVRTTRATPFTSDHGIKGQLSTATVTGVKKSGTCATDGKAYAVTYTDANGDFATWVLYAAKGVKGELPDATIKKIMSTLRPLKSTS